MHSVEIHNVGSSLRLVSAESFQHVFPGSLLEDSGNAENDCHNEEADEEHADQEGPEDQIGACPDESKLQL